MPAVNVTFNLRDKKYNSNENIIIFLAVEKTRTGFEETSNHTQGISGDVPDSTTQRHQSDTKTHENIGSKSLM